MRHIRDRRRHAQHVRCGESITRLPHDEPMAFEIVEITLASNEQKIVRTQRVPVGSSFSDLGMAIQAAMGWNGGEPHKFRIPGAGAEIDDESIMMTTYGRLPIEYVYGGIVHKIRFLGESKRDFSSSWFSDRRSESRSEVVRRCIRTWYDEITTSRYLDSKALEKVADAIASNRKKNLYLDLKSMKVVDSRIEGSTVLIKRKDSDFLYRTASAFADNTPSLKRPDSNKPDWYQKFITETARNSKISKAWSDYIEKESESAAETWAEDNGIWTDGISNSNMRLPCMTCGVEREAVEDRTIGKPAMMGRPRFPMVVRCPECKTTSQLFMFNDGFVMDYCFRKDFHPCWMARDAIRAKNRAESEADPKAKAKLLLFAALESYRCDKLGDAESLINEASGALPDESKVISSFIRDEDAPDVGDIDPDFVPILSCLELRTVEKADEATVIVNRMESGFDRANLPEWLVWETRYQAMLSPSNEDDKEKAFSRMEDILSRYLDRISSYKSISSDDYRRACRMFEIAVRFAYDELGFERAGPVIDMMCKTFDGKLDNVPSKAIALFRRGLYRMIVEKNDDGAVKDLVEVVVSMLSNIGRGPVTGRRAFASMAILYIYDPDSMDLVTLALNSMNAMSVTGAFSDEELMEMETVVSRILKAVGGYEEARIEVKSRTNIDLGPEPEGDLALEDLMDIRCSYYT